MIKLTKLNQEVIFVNPDLIEFIDAMPDTMLSMTTNKKLNVLETPEEVIDRIIEYRGAISSFSVRKAEEV